MLHHKRDNALLNRSLSCSVLLHVIIFVFCVVSHFLPKKNNFLLMEVELSGGGENAIMSPNDTVEPPPELLEPIVPEERIEEPPIENVINGEGGAEAKSDPMQAPESAQEPTGDMSESVPPFHDDVPETKPAELPPQEEAVPNLDEKPKEVPAAKEKPKKKKRKKNALSDVIKRVEKKKSSEDRRKKIADLVEKSANAKNKKNDAFNKMLEGAREELRRSSDVGGFGEGLGYGSGGSGDGNYDKIIGTQIERNWIVPAGVRDAEQIVVSIRIQLKDNGEIIAAGIKVLDERRYATDLVFRAVADSARRAIIETGCLKIPKDKINLFRDFVFNFNLAEALKGRR